MAAMDAMPERELVAWKMQRVGGTQPEMRWTNVPPSRGDQRRPREYPAEKQGGMVAE